MSLTTNKKRVILSLLAILYVITFSGLLLFLRPTLRDSLDILFELSFTFQPIIWIFLAKMFFKNKPLLPQLYIGCVLFLIGGIFEIIEDTYTNNQLIDDVEDLLILTGTLFITFSIFKITKLNLEKISMLSEQNRENYINSINDSLTDLYNKRYLMTNFTDIFDQNPSIFINSVCVFIDIDNFKIFNDDNGHEAGDILLGRLGEIICDSKRKGDFAFRYGGEEFLIFYMNTKPDYIYKKLDKIRIKFKDFTDTCYPHKKVSFTLSIGSTIYNYGEDLTDIIHRADKAMYISKFSGKNKISSI